MTFDELFEKIDTHMGRLYEEHSRAVMRMADIERRLDNSLRHGKVTDVDTKKQLFRMEVAKQDGKPMKSPWIPYGQTAGDYKHHRPPTKGQQMTVFSPNGEMRQSVALPMTWSDKNKSPSEKEDEHVTAYGKKYRLKEKEDERSFTLDKTKQTFKDNKITLSINDGNTPGDDNGAKADETSSTVEQQGQGSSITQEQKKITHKTPGVTVTHDENDYEIEASQTITISADVSIELTVGGSTITIDAGKIAAIAALVKAGGGRVMLGVVDKDGIALPKVLTEDGPSEKVRAKID